MDALTFSQQRLSKGELLLGFGGSFAAHVAFFAAVLILPWAMPRKSVQIPFYTVNLVSVQELGSAGTSSSKAASGSASLQTPKSKGAEKNAKSSKPRVRSAPVVPVKRLQFDEPKSRAETELKRLQTDEAPEMEESVQAGVSVDKSLDKLIPKPKARPKPAPVTQDSGEESDKTERSQASGQEPAGGPRTKAAKDEKSGPPGARGGPSGSEAGSPNGAAIGLARRLYYTEVWNAIRRQWALPEFLKSQKLEAVLVVVVRRDGRILSLQFEKKSGQALFDESVERAVRKADPLPPFPEIYSPPKEEIGLRFRPEDLA